MGAQARPPRRLSRRDQGSGRVGQGPIAQNEKGLTMIERNTTKATFTIERTYPAKPARVFKAFSDEQSKRKWFGGGDEWVQLENAFDFRVDGTEINIGRHASGVVSAFYCTYHDIVPDERIVYAYRMTLDGKPLS